MSLWRRPLPRLAVSMYYVAQRFLLPLIAPGELSASCHDFRPGRVGGGSSGLLPGDDALADGLGERAGEDEVQDRRERVTVDVAVGGVEEGSAQAIAGAVEWGDGVAEVEGGWPVMDAAAPGDVGDVVGGSAPFVVAHGLAVVVVDGGADGLPR